MQNTLLGLAIVLILALVAALVGPLLIDWGTYRALFEKEASHIAGVDVRVSGDIDARLLPAPRLILQGIAIGGEGKVRARALTLEFSLGALMRGEWRATEMRLSGPEVALGLDENGKVQAPSLAVAFDPDALSIERLSIEEGKITLADAASKTSLVLDRFWFNGDARSLIGPYRGEGGFAIAGELYPYRLNAGRYGDEGTVRVRLNIDPVNRPLAIETDGTLTLAGGTPSFEGNIALTRPVAIGKQGVTPPWRLSGKVKARAQSALIENLDFLYGQEEQGVKLSGVADLAFGARPLFNIILSGRQIDLDRSLANADGTRPAPAAALRQLAVAAAGLIHPGVPVQLGLGIDQVTLGGAAVQNVRGDLSSGAGVWNLDRLEFRAPGFTQMRVSGAVSVSGNGVAFTGPAEIDAADARALTAWLEGRGDVGQNESRPLKLRGELALASDRIAVERLTAEFERRSVSGRLAYVFATATRPASLEAVLTAPELDVDGALAFGRALAAGSALQRPNAIGLSADIGRATVAGFSARDLSARVKVDGDGLQIDKLSVADLGGAAFSAEGRILTSGQSPQGNMRVDLNAPDLAPVLAILSRVAPDTANALASRAAAMAPARLRAQLSIEGASNGRLALNGSLGAMRVALNAQGRVDPVAFVTGDLRLDGKIETADGKRLLALVGLERFVGAGSGAGVLTFNASGPVHGDMNVDAKLVAGSLDGSVNGTARLFDGSRTAALRATVARADLAPLSGRGGLPVTYNGRVALAGTEWTFSDINATVAGASLRGRLVVNAGESYRLAGTLDADRIDAPALIGAAVGMPPSPDGASGWSWSSEPFASGAFGPFSGDISLTARRVTLLANVTARDLRGAVRFGTNEIVFDDITAVADGGGRLTGKLALQSSNGALKALGNVALSGADAAVVLRSGPRPAVSGVLGFSAEIEGAGLSPVALIGSLQGKGTISLANGQLAELDPRAFDAVTRAVDQGLTIDANRIGDVVRRALGSGQLAVRRGEGTLAFSAGQLRLSDVTADSQDAGVSLSGNLDLLDGALDARLVLSGKGEAGGLRPDIYMALKGPLAAPSRSIDVSALTGWLTLRSVESQAKKLQTIERVERAGQQKPLAPPVLPPPMPPADSHSPGLAPALPPPVIIGPGRGPPSRSPASVGAQN